MNDYTLTMELSNRMNDTYTLTMALTVAGLQSERHAEYIRDHLTMLAKMAGYNVTVDAAVTKAEPPKPPSE